MDSSCEENRSNGDSDFELNSSTVSKSGRKKASVMKKSVVTKEKKPAPPAEKKDKVIIVKKETTEDGIITLGQGCSTPLIIKKEVHSCDYCDKTFTIQRHLKNHCRKIHDVDIETNINETEEFEKNYECDLCDCSYTRVSGLKQHQRQKHGASFQTKEKLFTCDVCYQKYDTHHFLELHRADKHGTVLNGTEVEHECKTCGETFTKYRAFRLHRKQHETKKHVCEVCGKFFARADSLLSHRKFTHMGHKRNRKTLPQEKKFVCEICGSGFYRRSNLNEHFLMKHSNEPLNHQCGHCDKTFSRPSLMEYHINKVHLNTKPYTCDKCQKKCYSKHSLHEHKNICSMTLEKKKRCEQCGKLFTSNHNYRLHMQAVHSAPALVCPCGTVVRWQSSVAKHKRRCHLYNAKHRKNRKEPLDMIEQVISVESGEVPENAAVVYLQGDQMITETGEEYSEEAAGEGGSTTVVVSEAEAEVAESVSRLLEGIPGGALVAGAQGGHHDVTVVEEQVVGGEAAVVGGVSQASYNIVTQDGQDSQKIYYVIQY